MPKQDDNIISVEIGEGRYHKVTLIVPERPEHPSEYLNFFKQTAEDFATEYTCKLVKLDDVYINPFNDNAVMFFTVKEWKHPEKHRPKNKFENLR